MINAYEVKIILWFIVEGDGISVIVEPQGVSNCNLKYSSIILRGHAPKDPWFKYVVSLSNKNNHSISIILFHQNKL